MKHILITGITGFVGTSLVKHLYGNDHIRIIGHSRNIHAAKAMFESRNIEFINTLSVEKLNKNQIDAIIHLAGIAHDLSGKYGAVQYHEANYLQTTKLYDEFLRSEAKAFVFVSSVKAVVDHTDEIIDENTSPSPASEYGKSKRQAEEYIEGHKLPGKSVFILRPCMIHGPGNKGNLNLLYKFVKLGLPYPLGSFENERSFHSIDNFCFVIQQIVDEKLPAGVYLLSDNEPISTVHLVEIIGDAMNKRVRIFRFPKKFIRGLARIGSFTKMPFNSQVLDKLSENMIVSNQKLLLNLGEELPVSTSEGLQKTIKSFNE